MDNRDAATPDALPDVVGMHAVAAWLVMDHPDSGSGDQAAHWEVAGLVRREHSRWVVIRSALRDEFQARPLFRAPPGIVVTGAISQQITARMNAVELAAPRSGGPARA
jgi:hypothetical protein